MLRLLLCLVPGAALAAAEDFPKPYGSPCTEREEVFAFAEKPAVRTVGADNYEITFESKGNCDVTVGIVDEKGKVVRHLGAGVLGANAPTPFQKNSLKQKIYWNGKDDLQAYPKEPGRLRVRVGLGLRPAFDKRLGDTNPKNLPGFVLGIAAGEEGVFLLAKGMDVSVRKFDHGGKYVGEIFPPRSDRPLDKQEGMGFVEYESGAKALHARDVRNAVSDAGCYMPALYGKDFGDIQQPLLVGNRLYFVNAGFKADSTLYYIHTDGTTDEKGIGGRIFGKFGHYFPRLAASPDGRRIYLANLGFRGYERPAQPVVVSFSADGPEQATPFAGEAKMVGSDSQHFADPAGIDCDAAGRVYVADVNNNRVQAFSPDGKLLKSIPVDRPRSVLTPKQSGGVYVLHAARRNGQTISRLTKFASFEDPREEYHVDDFQAAVMAVDSWAPRPRLWASGTLTVMDGLLGGVGKRGVRIYEEDGKGLCLIEDFEESHKKDGGESWFGGWSGRGQMDRTECDPVREQVYYKDGGIRLIFDLKSGALLGEVEFPGMVDDIAFDKRGYMHMHFNPGFYFPGVGRCDPGRLASWPEKYRMRAGGRSALPNKIFKEVPYDYGEEAELGSQTQVSVRTQAFGEGRWSGILPVKDQPGGKFFQDGIGVNMYGDVAEECNISHVPKLGDAFKDQQFKIGPKWEQYAAAIRRLKEGERDGQAIYSFRRGPGLPPSGAMIWTFDASGELRCESAVLAGGLINGVQIDEGGQLYFTSSASRLCAGKPFLAGHGGIVGSVSGRLTPFTGTFCKTREKSVVFLHDPAPIPLEADQPKRPPDVAGGLFRNKAVCWVVGAEWLYAGASPIVDSICSCPTSRFHTDWYKRSFVPEMYRHSFAVLDANGNLVMHLGRYGNFDECPGKTGAWEEITLAGGRFVGGTDEYLVYPDRGERITVLTLGYRAEETVPIASK